jgi:hypothetical protein
MKVVAVPRRLRIEESARIAREKFGAYLIASESGISTSVNAVNFNA